MTGISSSLIGSYTAAKTAYVPRNVKQVVAGFASKDRDDKPKADVSKMKSALRRGTENLARESNVSVIDNMQLYSKALKKQRETNRNTDLAKKKVKYSFKRISSKIISSKTSTAAREAVSQARREIQKLKAARRTGKYDEEELEAAIDHAKSMERIARKKARHLEEEEMAKRCSKESDQGSTPVVDDGDTAEKDDPVEEEIDKLRDEIRGMKETADNEEYIESEEITNEMISEIAGSMQEMLDSIDDLNDLMNELMENPVDMDPEDIKAMTIKHRNKEMKEITKADADYLKAMFEHFENIKANGEMSTSSINVAL